MISVTLAHTEEVTSACFGLDENVIISGSDDRTVRIWDALSGKCLQVLEGHQGQVRTVAFSPNGSLLASGSEDGTIKIWGIP